MGVFAFPFNEERVRNEGASSFEEFRDWVFETLLVHEHECSVRDWAFA